MIELVASEPAAKAATEESVHAEVADSPVRSDDQLVVERSQMPSALGPPAPGAAALMVLLGAGDPGLAGSFQLASWKRLAVVNSPVNGDGVSLYAEANWDDAGLPGIQAPANNAINHSAQTPAGIDAAVTVGNGGVAGGPNGAGSATALFQTNNNSVTLSGAGSSLIFLSAGDTGLAGNNSTVDLAGGFLADSPVVSWGSITAEQLFTAGVLGSLTVNGAAAVWGSDPLVEEPGDNVLFTAEVFNRLNDGTLPRNAYYTTNRSGFSMIAIPEPGTAVLMLGGALLMFRRRRVLA